MKPTEDSIFQILLSFLTAAEIILTSAIKKWLHISSAWAISARCIRYRRYGKPPPPWSRLKKCKVCKRRKNSLLSYIAVSAAFVFFSTQTRADRGERLFPEQKTNKKENSVCGCGWELEQTAGWLLQAERAHNRGAAGLYYYNAEEKSCFVDGES